MKRILISGVIVCLFLLPHCAMAPQHEESSVPPMEGGISGTGHQPDCYVDEDKDCKKPQP